MLTVSPIGGKPPPPKMWCPENDTKLHQIVRLKFWRSEKCGALVYCYYFQVHSDVV